MSPKGMRTEFIIQLYLNLAITVLKLMDRNLISDNMNLGD